MAVTPTSEDSEITVVYGKAPDKSRKPNQPAQPEKPGQIDYQGQPQEIPSASAETRNKLPQTGDDNDSALAAGFIGLTSLLAMLGLGKKRKQD
ncbi:LPXTG cell wall anchor domain-containing protein [Limosilactobacillus reuteri]|nr:LPXTG cell wall anchor domain-containing protein [Limosilactobacillus reuteri]MDZ5436892.1 LPXTG cell wall anchor domain-containing protein [Limosilactobacillus reuteri]